MFFLSKYLWNGSGKFKVINKYFSIVNTISFNLNFDAMNFLLII